MANWTPLWETPTSRTHLVSDNHNETRKIFHTVEYDDHILESTKRIRNEELMKRGDALKLLDGLEVIAAFQVPPIAWARFQRDYPDIVAGIRSKDDHARQKAARELAILHPEWVTVS